MHGGTCGGVRVAPSGRCSATARVQVPVTPGAFGRGVSDLRIGTCTFRLFFSGFVFLRDLNLPIRFLAGPLLFFMNLGVNNGFSTLQ